MVWELLKRNQTFPYPSKKKIVLLVIYSPIKTDQPLVLSLVLLLHPDHVLTDASYSERLRTLTDLSFIPGWKWDLQSSNHRGLSRYRQIICFPQFTIISSLSVSPRVPAVSTSVLGGPVSSFFLAPFPLVYCCFFLFPYSVRHPFLGLLIFLPYMCGAENIKGVITADFKDCPKFISVDKKCWGYRELGYT